MVNPLRQNQISNSPAETQSIAKAFARELTIGDTIALIGPLGAGKTQFVKGIVEGLGGMEDISSPTFTLLHEYATPKAPVYHLDFYRLKNEKEVQHLGFEDLNDGITIIEWADRFPAILPRVYWKITISPEAEMKRSIQIVGNCK